MARVYVVACTFSLVGCVEGPEDVFEREVVPVLEGRCATPACHGVSPDQPWPETEGLFVAVDRSGRLTDLAEARRVAKERIVTESPALLSSLVRVPLPRTDNGGPHAGGALFVGVDDPALEAIVRWIEAEPDGTGGEDLDLEPLEVQFGETVLPVLARRCGFAGCHGPTEVAFTAFPGRPDTTTGVFAPVDVRAARGVARKHLDLWGADVMQSRLIRKALGPEEGGLVHRGGFTTFFPEAPPGEPLESDDLRALVDWARAERAAMGVEEGHGPSALLWVQGPAAERSPWRIENGPVGSDLWMTVWPPGTSTPENLTASLHPGGDAEVRDPAVAHDGEMVAFAMRLDGERSFALWVMDLESREASRLTPPDARGSFVQPTWAPDGRVIAAWDGHGEVGADADGVAPELVAVTPDGALERLTWTPAPEVSPAFLAAGKTRGELVFGTRRNGPTGPEGVLFRFPLCHDPDRHGEPEYHVQFGASLAPAAPLVARDLPDGRQIMLMLDGAEATDDRGRLAVLDRALGPALAPEHEDEASMGGYRRPVAWLGEDARWRDPAPLPDGRVLVSDDAIHVIDVEDTVDGARLGAVEELLRVDGAELRSPVAVFPRPPEDTHLPVVDPTAADGYMVLRDVAVLESIYGRAAPRGERALRERIGGIRLLAWGGARASAFSRLEEGGTTVGLSSRPPARLLGEVDLPADRSAWIRIPARTPVLTQLLDRRGMVIGEQLDRWFYAEGEEVVPGGTNLETYAHACSGCHGAASGRPEDATSAPPDALSSASVTLARYEDRDRRRPLSPVDLTSPAETIDWVSTVAPVFADRCASGECHGGAEPAAGLALDGRGDADRFDAGYTELVRRSVDLEGLRARRSPLVERLLGEELDAPAPLDGVCPPGGADEALVRTVTQWIEAGAFHDVSAAGVGDAD